MHLRIPGSLFAIGDGEKSHRKEARRQLARLGAVPVGPNQQPDFVVSCDPGDTALPRNWFRLDQLLAEGLRVHRVRDLRAFRTAVARTPRQCILHGKTITTIGGLSGGDTVRDLAARLGAQVLPAPEIDADIVVCGLVDVVGERLEAVRREPQGRMILSEWQFYDLCETQFSPLVEDEAQGQLLQELVTCNFIQTRRVRTDCALNF